MPQLQILIASTRPGRVGEPVGRWVRAQAEAHGGFDLDVVDLLELDLPMMNERHHPRLGRYEHEHTKRWSARVAAADAFVWVMPEYNYGYTAPLKNAFDYLHAEWSHKPLGFVSYGGVSGGTRAVQLIKPVVSALSVVPVNAGVIIPFVGEKIRDGEFAASDLQVDAARAMLDALRDTEAALRPLREAAAAAR